LIESLVEREDRREAILAGLRDSDLPLVFYGAGASAEALFNMLSAAGVAEKVLGVFASDPYCTPGLRFHGMEVVPRSALADMPFAKEKFDVLAAFYIDPHWKGLMSSLYDLPFVNRVLTLDFSGPSIDYAYVLEHREAFDETYSLLDDQRSRDTLVAWLNMKITHDSSCLWDYVTDDQYFPRDVPLGIGSDEVLADCGAYSGETAIRFAELTGGRYRRIYCVEPSVQNAVMLRERLRGLKDVTIVPKAAWDREETLHFLEDDNCAHVGEREREREREREISVQADSLEHILGDDADSPIITMDIEGSELRALRGAERIISRGRARLAVCVYHKLDDMITIPQYIKSVMPSARLYFRTHTCSFYEQVLYAVPAQ
jgi:FkbM family methyltransferase